MEQPAVALPHGLRVPAGAEPQDAGLGLLAAAPRRIQAIRRALNGATRPFHVINYAGSLFGARTLGYARMERLMDRVLGDLQKSLRAQPERALERGMHFPAGWDPYFRNYMTLRDIYLYPTQHYDHHRRQLTPARARGL